MATKENGRGVILQIIRGVPFSNTSFFARKNIEDAMDYVPKDGDVIVTSYPKTGTTWMQYITMQVMSKATLFSNFDDVTSKLHPYIEMAGVAAVEALRAEPRMYKHHLPYNMVQKNGGSKSIYTYRHPEDVVVSFYHFYNNIESQPSFEFEEYFVDFLTGNKSYGSYFSHVLSFYEHRDDANLLMVSYEKLHANRRDEILRIAKFLGEEYHTCLVEQEGVLQKVMEHTSFEYMKKNLYLSHPESRKDGRDRKLLPFFRKGIVGDGKSVLTENQRQKLKEAAKATLKGTRIFQEWYPE